MNKTRSQADEFLKELAARKIGENNDIVICPPYVDLALVREYADEIGFTVGAQNFACGIKGGAMTGEISLEMLDEIGVKTVLTGHSERRAYFGETDAIVAQKVSEAVQKGIMPILCVGETLEQREGGKMRDILKTQLKSKGEHKNIVVAYEPVWAIGTGKVATTEQIAETHKFIKSIIGRDVPLLYGGSVNDANAAEILALKDVDGVLVGGAGLDVEKFTKIAKAFRG
jgi:triosephosphate isomerase